MKSFDLSLYLVTDRSMNQRLNIFQIVEEAVTGGVTIVQLREKATSPHAIKELGIGLLKILRPRGIPLLINDFPEIAREIGAEGVHLGSTDMNPRRAREILGDQAIIGLSIESLDHFRIADLTEVDYLAASPVFPTSTKADIGRPFLLENLGQLCRVSHLPVVAIGNIHLGNVREVFETKVAGIAVVSAICGSVSPRTAARELKNKGVLSQSTPPRVLSIAGSDSGGGAGIQADLKTFQALQCYGMSAITALTAQNTVAVRSVFPVTPTFVQEQLEAVLEDIGVDAVKIGMLFSKEIIKVVRESLLRFGVKNVVLDPVMVAKSGDRLLLPDAAQALQEFLFPLATIVTPNLPEAEELTVLQMTSEPNMMEAVKVLRKQGNNILLKGGHGRDPNQVHDLLMTEDGSAHWFRYPRIHTKNTHGTGCTYSAAIAAHLAKGMNIFEAVQASREYLQKAIIKGQRLNLGKGSGPVEHRCV